MSRSRCLPSSETSGRHLISRFPRSDITVNTFRGTLNWGPNVQGTVSGFFSTKNNRGVGSLTITTMPSFIKSVINSALLTTYIVSKTRLGSLNLCNDDFLLLKSKNFIIIITLYLFRYFQFFAYLFFLHYN